VVRNTQTLQLQSMAGLLGRRQRIIEQTAEHDGKAVRIREAQEPGGAGKTVVAARTKLLAGFDYPGAYGTPRGSMKSPQRRLRRMTTRWVRRLARLAKWP
jgi:hypothetical protein